MASVLEKITQALTEVRILREAYEKSCSGWKDDHDMIIALSRDNKTIFHRLGQTQCPEHAKSLEIIENAIEGLKDRVEDIEEAKDKEEDRKRSRNWEVTLMIIGTLFGALATGVIGTLIARSLGG